MSVPDYAVPVPRPGELSALLRRGGMLALRYPARGQAGIPAGLYVCRDKGYSIQNVSPSLRQAVRKGLRACEIRPVQRTELLTQGLECNRDTMRRQGRWDPEFGDPERWKRFVDAAWQVPAIEVTGAFAGGRLAAYILGCLDDGRWSLLYTLSRSHLRILCANHALMFSAVEHHIHRPEVLTVCAGPKTLLVQDGLHAFKTRLGFKAEFNVVVIRVHPFVEPLMANTVAEYALGALQRLWPGRLKLERIAAFLKSAHAARKFAQGTAPGDWPTSGLAQDTRPGE